MLKEEIIVTAQLRNAAGVCALTIGLLVCSSAGAVAFADSTEASGGTSVAQTASANTTSSASTHRRGPLSTIRGALSTIRGALTNARGPSTTSNSGAVVVAAPTSIVGNGRGDVDPDGAPTTTVSAQTNTTGDNQDRLGDDQGAVAGLDTDVVEAEATPGPVVNTPPSVTNPPTSEPVVASAESNIPPAETAESGAPVGTVTASTSKSASQAVTTVTNAPGQIAKTVLDPVADAVVTVARAFGTATLTLVSLPGSKTPITDVITAVQIMISAVVDAVVEVARVPGDLASLFGVAAYDARPPMIGARSALESVARGPVNPLLVGVEAPQLPVAAAGVPLFGSVIRASHIGDVAATTSLKNELTLSGLAPVRSGVSPATTSFLDNVVRSVLAPASLTALAAIAVPGIGGLLIVCAAGIRVGYRQAKAGLALRASGIARFAGPGPLGVVRSGGLIALHTRTPRLGKPHATRAVAKTARAPRLLESVA